jgi:undecaprenyl-diphosphatase
MFDYSQGLLLAIVQGLTEFLPISSSAHLILPAKLLGWPDQGLAFDVAVHFGSLLAVVWYFRKDLTEMALHTGRAVVERRMNKQAQMVWWLGLATVPAGLAGFLLNDWIESELRSVVVIASSTLVFGLLLGFADRQRGSGTTLSLRIVLLIGCAQVLALVPGTSRSGITITAGLLLGLDRKGAARFSFLLSIPIIGAAGLLQTIELAGGGPVDWQLIAIASAVSALTAYACIGLFLRLVERVGLLPFVIYRCLLAAVLFWIWW